MTDGNTTNQSAFPFSNTGVFNKIRMVLRTRSAIDETVFV